MHVSHYPKAWQNQMLQLLGSAFCCPYMEIKKQFPLFCNTCKHLLPFVLTKNKKCNKRWGKCFSNISFIGVAWRIKVGYQGIPFPTHTYRKHSSSFVINGTSSELSGKPDRWSSRFLIAHSGGRKVWKTSWSAALHSLIYLDADAQSWVHVSTEAAPPWRLWGWKHLAVVSIPKRKSHLWPPGQRPLWVSAVAVSTSSAFLKQYGQDQKAMSLFLLLLSKETEGQQIHRHQQA